MDRLIKENKAICEPSLTCPNDAPGIQLSYVVIFVSPSKQYIVDCDTEITNFLTSLTDFFKD